MIPMTRMTVRHDLLSRALAAAAVLGLVAGAPGASRLPAAAPKLTVYFAADFKDPVYQQKTYTKVASAWRRPAQAPKPGGKAVVNTVIQQDGSATQIFLHYKSGSDAWDAAALEAVRKAAPFDPLPKTYPRPSVEVHFHFEYN
jgi:periplasmic protein TonB